MLHKKIFTYEEAKAVMRICGNDLSITLKRVQIFDRSYLKAFYWKEEDPMPSCLKEAMSYISLTAPFKARYLSYEYVENDELKLNLMVLHRGE